MAISGDEAFLAEAYQQLFGRQPDPAGLVEYRFHLRQGLSRAALLASMARSPEGRACQVELSSLPPESRPGLASRLAGFIRLKTRWLFWRVVDRPSELVALRLEQADLSRSWELTYQAASTLINRQRMLETQIHRWRREMGDRAAAATGCEIDVDGMRLAFPTGDYAAMARAAVERHVPRGLAALLARVLKPGMVVADAGAGAGVFSVFAARHIQPGGKLYALETRPALEALLAKNLHSNGLRNDFGAACPVDFAALDSILAGEPRLDLLRLALVGAEASALRGMSQLIASRPLRHILWEASPAALNLHGANPAAILDPLVDSGFRAFRVCPVTGVLLPLPDGPWEEPLLVWFDRESADGDRQG